MDRVKETDGQREGDRWTEWRRRGRRKKRRGMDDTVV